MFCVVFYHSRSNSETRFPPWFSPNPFTSRVPFPQLCHNLHEAGAKRGLANRGGFHTHRMLRFDLFRKSLFCFKNAGETKKPSNTTSHLWRFAIVVDLLILSTFQGPKHIDYLSTSASLITSRKLPNIPQKSAAAWIGMVEFPPAKKRRQFSSPHPKNRWKTCLRTGALQS